MRKMIAVFLMLGLLGGAAALAQYKPMLETNGIELEQFNIGDNAGAYMDSVGSAGNKIVVWIEGTRIKAKMIDSNGIQIWNNLISTNETNAKKTPMFIETSDGNLVFAWTDYRRGEGPDVPEIVMIKYSMNGGELTSEVEVYPGATAKSPQIAPDDEGGCYLAYLVGADHYAISRYNSNLGEIWNTLPNGFVGSTGNTRYKLISGGSGDDNHAFVVFSTNEVTGEVKAAYITTTGVGPLIKYLSLGLKIELFDALELGGKFYVVSNSQDGNILLQVLYYDVLGSLVIESSTTVCDATGRQWIPRIITDGTYLYICWIDERNYVEGAGNDLDIYIQKCTTGGAPQWTPNGLPVTHADQGIKSYYLLDNSGKPMVNQQPMVYGNGRVYLAWHDFRRSPAVSKDAKYSEELINTPSDIFMQAVNTSDGSMLNGDLPLASAAKLRALPVIMASSPFAGWADLENFPASVPAKGQRADNIPTIITALVTSPASANIKIQGRGFGCDPSLYANQDVALYSAYNNVKVNGSTVEVTAWTTDEITVNFSYDALSTGLYNFTVTAYGDTSAVFPLTKQSSVVVQNAHFGGTAYSSGMYVPSSVTMTGEVVSVHSLASATARVDGTTSSLTLTNNIFSKALSLSSGAHVITIEAVDIYGGSGALTCNITVGGGLEFTDMTFDGKSYLENDFVSASPNFICKVAGDYAVTELKLSAGSGGGAEINMLPYYNADTKYLNIPDLGVHIAMAGDVAFTLTAKDANSNTAAKTFRVKVAAQPAVKDVAATNVTANQDAKLGFNYGGQSVSGISGTGTLDASPRVRIIMYSPSGAPIMLEYAVTIGYNEMTIPASTFPSNGIYIVKIYDGKRVIGETRIVVLK